MKVLIGLISIAFLAANVVMAVWAVFVPLHDGVLRPWMTVMGATNTLVVAFLTGWGLRQAAARERLLTALIDTDQRLGRVEVEILLLLHRFKREHRNQRPYQLESNFVKDGSFHLALRALRTARLVVSLTPENGERIERGRFRFGDQVDITPIGLILCNAEVVKALAHKPRDEFKWIELRSTLWDRTLDVGAELNRRAVAYSNLQKN